ncbi:unnamed protein product [Phaedon cochleariae]|uniref:Zinc finger PHD-type domain-containing protein n=1 Tax=Phaedon cochleariae TaxID=80249 RepID=A0A9N9WX64_PHACE|nr:unnamed protein product [Phaedon cochleariae]
MPNCQTCLEAIFTSDSSLICSVCKLQWHSACARPQPVLPKSNTLGAWKCEKCIANPSDITTTHFEAIMAQFMQLNNTISMCNTKIHDLTQLVTSQSATINACVSDIEGLRKDSQELQDKISTLEAKVSVPNFSAEDMYMEIAERSKREANVIICGLNESRTDQVEAQAIIDKIAPGNNITISSILRLGKPRSDQKSRPLRVTLSSPANALLILKNKSKLPSTPPNNVYIKADNTPMQSKYFKEVKAELDRRIQAGENDITIKYMNKIILDDITRLRREIRRKLPENLMTEEKTWGNDLESVLLTSSQGSLNIDELWFSEIAEFMDNQEMVDASSRSLA